jgi:hypothetical protein
MDEQQHDVKRDASTELVATKVPGMWNCKIWTISGLHNSRNEVTPNVPVEGSGFAASRSTGLLERLVQNKGE